MKQKAAAPKPTHSCNISVATADVRSTRKTNNENGEAVRCGCLFAHITNVNYYYRSDALVLLLSQNNKCRMRPAMLRADMAIAWNTTPKCEWYANSIITYCVDCVASAHTHTVQSFAGAYKQTKSASDAVTESKINDGFHRTEIGVAHTADPRARVLSSFSHRLCRLMGCLVCVLLDDDFAQTNI